MEEVYLVDVENETIIGEGKRNSSGEVVVENALDSGEDFEVVPVHEFYQADCLQDIIPQGLQDTQIHVECMKCGFETVYGVQALLREYKPHKGLPKWSSSCRDCGANAWREVRRQLGPCDWSDDFDWADPLKE